MEQFEHETINTTWKMLKTIWKTPVKMYWELIRGLCQRMGVRINLGKSKNWEAYKRKIELQQIQGKQLLLKMNTIKQIEKL